MANASGVSSSASDLVMMASQVGDHPQSRLHRCALALVAAEVIRTYGDAAILAAIELAPELKIARAIRQAAEAACEAGSTTSNGVEHRARLFSIALVVRFAEPFSTQELDDRLAPILGTGSLLANVHELGSPRTRSFIWPYVWTFDDLSSLSLYDVRRQTIFAATESVTNGGTSPPFPLSAPAQRRSATFLRYLVGRKIAEEEPSEHSADSVRFCECVRSVLCASLPDAQDLAVLYTGRFYRTLWDGLWRYQSHRLDDVVAAMTARGLSAHRLQASITLPGNQNEMAAQIAFLNRGRKIDHQVYQIALEALADPAITVARLGATLRNLGVRTRIAPQCTSRYVGKPMSRATRRLARYELAVPL